MYIFFLVVAGVCNNTTLRYVMGLDGLKTRNTLRQHYEGELVGQIDRSEHYVVYGQPLKRIRNFEKRPARKAMNKTRQAKATRGNVVLMTSKQLEVL